MKLPKAGVGPCILVGIFAVGGVNSAWKWLDYSKFFMYRTSADIFGSAGISYHNTKQQSPSLYLFIFCLFFSYCI